MGQRLRRPPYERDGVLVIRLTKGLEAIIDVQDAELGQFNWFANGKGYAERRVGPKGAQASCPLHSEVARRAGKYVDGLEVDHIDRDPLNNRRRNLRAATRSQNEMNTRGHRDSRSGRKGVTWDSARRKWKAQIQVSGKDHYLGGFENIDDAAKAYADAALKLHGEFARTA